MDKNVKLESCVQQKKMVSFLNLPSYIEDEDIVQKLVNWGVTPILPVRRRFYPGTTVADGTRFLRVKFSQEVTSLPYNTKFMTEEGAQFFRVIHDNQVKTCRLCSSAEHERKDCPLFACRECLVQGHYARDCKALRCQGCNKTMLRCSCETDEEEYEEEEMDIQEEMEDTTVEKQNESLRQNERSEDKQNVGGKEDKNPEEDAGMSKREEYGMDMEKRPYTKDDCLNKEDLLEKQEYAEDIEQDDSKGQGEDGTEGKETKTLNEVRKVEMRGESFGVQSKGKVSLNRGIKSRVKDTSINIEQVLKKQRIRREEQKERMERRKVEMRESRFASLEETELE